MRFLLSRSSRRGREGVWLLRGRTRPRWEQIVQPLIEGLVEAEIAEPGVLPRGGGCSRLGRGVLDVHACCVDLIVPDGHPGQDAHEGVGDGLILEDGVVVAVR